MMSNLHNDEVLFTNKFCEVRRKDGWFIYTHSPWTGGFGVGILAYRKGDNGEREYLGRFELNPIRAMVPTMCSMKGGYDNSDKFTLMECALNELREEGGYDAPVGAVTELGVIHPYKSSTSLMHLYAVDLDHEGVEPCEATTDGTRGEEGSYCEWVNENELIINDDSVNHSMLLRLKVINPA